MEKGIQINRPGASLTLSDTGVRIAKVIVAVNDLIPMRLNSDDIISWSKDIERLVEADELKKLPFLMDCFKTDKISYDRNKGIQNIFNGLKRLKENEDGTYEILKEIW